MVDDLDRLPLADLRDLVLNGDPSCLVDPELFTGPDEESSADRAVREAVAREMCESCPVRRPCLAYALLIRPTAGIWAGLTAPEITELANAGAVPAARKVAA